MPDHLDQTISSMADGDVDVLLLGRESNTRWATDANRLWLAGSRPFAPGCVVVRSPRSVHLLSITDDGLPETIPPQHLYPITWNPMNMLGAVAAIPGVAEARRIGVDGMSPLFDALIGAVLPDATLVDAEELLRDARRVKTEDDIAGIRSAAVVATDALDAMLAAFTPGTTPRALVGIFLERMCSHGVTTPAFEPLISIDGERVTVRAGVIRGGWEASLARTQPASAPGDYAGLVPGTSVGSLQAGGRIVEGVGMGHEELFDDDVLEPGMVVYVESAHDGAVRGDTVLITPTDPEVLTAR